MGLNESSAVSYYEKLQIQKDCWLWESCLGGGVCVAFITNFKNSMANSHYHNCIETRRKKTKDFEEQMTIDKER